MNFKPENSPIKLKPTNLKKVHFDTTSQLVRFGHWFTFFNMMIVIFIGSRYFFIANWPPTLLGRIYAMMSCVGHFGFLTFLVYLILIFPFSFILHSIKWQQIIAVLISSIGITLLLMDLTVFSMFKIHLDYEILELLISKETGELYQKFQRLFIFVPLIVAVEMVLAVWIWKKLRSLTKRKKYARPFIIFWLVCFCCFHLLHIWADVTFYRPITMQRQSLPFYSPLTARHFLLKSGFLNEQQFEAKQLKSKNELITNIKSKQIEYPLGKIQLKDETQKVNILLISIANWHGELVDYPKLADFGQKHAQFNAHYSASFNPELAEFSLLYGLDPNYYLAFKNERRSSVLSQTLTMRDYKQTPFLVEKEQAQNNKIQVNKLQSNQALMHRWLAQAMQFKSGQPWFSHLYLTLTKRTNPNQFDKELGTFLEQLDQNAFLPNTVVIIVGLNPEASKMESLLDRNQLKVPLLIAAPNQAPESIDYPTTHVDILATIMKNWLNVQTAEKQFTMGQNLFNSNENRIIIVGNYTELGAYFPEDTLLIKDQNHYSAYNLNGVLKVNNRLTAAQYLSVLSENRRFIVHH